MSELPPGYTDFLRRMTHPILGEPRAATAAAAAPAADYTVLGFDRELHCCYAAGPALAALGIETRPLGADTQAVPPALRTILRGLCCCVFAGAFVETVIEVGAQRLRLSGLPLLDSRGTISVALIRIGAVATPLGSTGSGAEPPVAVDPAGRTRRAGSFRHDLASGF